MTRSLLALAALSIAACSSPTASPDARADLRVDAQVTSPPDRAVDLLPPPDLHGTEALPPDGFAGPLPSKLPFVYQRPNVGSPVSAGELQALTDRYLELLKDTRYFDVIDERVHGWPESDPAKRYWYGTWWSGVTVTKQGGQVTYAHGADGADNNGLRTAQLMEGSCYAYLLWNKPTHEHLVHRIVRGFSSWMLAFKQQPNDPTQPLLSRAAYPASITSTDGGRTIIIDYSLNRPGIDNSATEYVHLPANPYWGDLWVKNKRSKDDLGEMFRAMGQVDSCAPRLSTAGAVSLAELRALYVAWSKQVEDDGWVIATLDKSLKVYKPADTLAIFFNLGGAECAGMLALRLMGRGDAGPLACGNGISLAEVLGGGLINSSSAQMLRTYHEAAANHALLAGQSPVAYPLLQGLALRLEEALTAIEAGKQPANLNTEDFAALIMHAANVGVPLTSREVRWLHARIDAAHAAFRAAALKPTFHVFDAATPDGSYAYEPGGSGLHFTDIGLALGSCASQYRNSAGQPLLDCARVQQAP